jgi:CRP-like cAMP-binding protein
MVYKGKRSNGVYLLVKGIARVQILTRNIRPEIGPGQICGEMSFLDNAPASANVIAHDNVEAYYIDRGTLEGLFELFPHLASRFYRSLATNLSNRLRDVIGPGAETLSANTAPIPPRVSFPALKNSKR